MKKLISLSVALTILLSAFGGFNVFAASEEMPYLYMDFEDDNINKLINDGVFALDKNGMFTKREWKADGLNGSDGCVSYTNGASGQMEFFYAMVSDSADSDNWACFKQIKPVDGAFSYTIPQSALGKKLKIEITPLDIENNLGVTSEMVIGEVRGKAKAESDLTEVDRLKVQNQILEAEKKRLEMEINVLKKLQEVERRRR